VPVSSKKDIAFFRRITLVKVPDERLIELVPSLVVPVDKHLFTGAKKKKIGLHEFFSKRLLRKLDAFPSTATPVLGRPDYSTEK